MATAPSLAICCHLFGPARQIAERQCVQQPPSWPGSNVGPYLITIQATRHTKPTIAMTAPISVIGERGASVPADARQSVPTAARRPRRRACRGTHEDESADHRGDELVKQDTESDVECLTNHSEDAEDHKNHRFLRGALEKNVRAGSRFDGRLPQGAIDSTFRQNDATRHSAALIRQRSALPKRRIAPISAARAATPRPG